MTKRLLEIAAEIVQTQAAGSQMSSDQIEGALVKTFMTLQRMQKAESDGVLLGVVEAAEELLPDTRALEKSDPKDSIREDKVICLECGAEMKQLTGKHLSSHNLTIRDYKQKWGFPLKQSLSAKVLSRARSKAAKKRGLPENLVKFQEQRKLKKAEAAMQEDTSAVNVAGPAETKELKVRGGRKKKAE